MLASLHASLSACMQVCLLNLRVCIQIERRLGGGNVVARGSSSEKKKKIDIVKYLEMNNTKFNSLTAQTAEANA